MIVLVTGPVRGGKSAFALELARASAKRAVYVATYDADPADPEMTARVARHRAERGSMPLIETSERRGPALAAVVRAASAGELLVVDSLGTWLAAHVLEVEQRAATDPDGAAAALERRGAELLDAFAALRADAVVVSEETGWGVVPGNLLGRLFRDQLGRTTAALAGRAENAYLVVAGYALDLKAGRRISG